MPGSVEWYYPDHVLIAHLSGDIALRTLEACFFHFDARITAADGEAPVHVILDTLAVGEHPTNLSGIVGAARRFFLNPRLGYALHITDQRVHRWLGSVAAQALQGRYKALDTLDEALYFLHDIDDTLAQEVQALEARRKKVTFD
ncbi:MAG: hypothetical protein ACLFTK_02015 [Anaerolineales bacterium]